MAIVSSWYPRNQDVTDSGRVQPIAPIRATYYAEDMRGNKVPAEVDITVLNTNDAPHITSFTATNHPQIPRPWGTGMTTVMCVVEDDDQAIGIPQDFMFIFDSKNSDWIIQESDDSIYYDAGQFTSSGASCKIHILPPSYSVKPTASSYCDVQVMVDDEYLVDIETRNSMFRHKYWGKVGSHFVQTGQHWDRKYCQLANKEECLDLWGEWVGNDVYSTGGSNEDHGYAIHWKYVRDGYWVDDYGWK